MEKSYDAATARRDLNPHKAARMAMWLWSANYAASGLGSMGYWDSLSEQARETCREAVSEIEDSPSESLSRAVGVGLDELL